MKFRLIHSFSVGDHLFEIRDGNEVGPRRDFGIPDRRSSGLPFETERIAAMNQPPFSTLGAVRR
jgi:hypothetical protein